MVRGGERRARGGCSWMWLDGWCVVDVDGGWLAGCGWWWWMGGVIRAVGMRERGMDVDGEGGE